MLHQVVRDGSAADAVVVHPPRDEAAWAPLVRAAAEQDRAATAAGRADARERAVQEAKAGLRAAQGWLREARAELARAEALSWLGNLQDEARAAGADDELRDGPPLGAHRHDPWADVPGDALFEAALAGATVDQVPTGPALGVALGDVRLDLVADSRLPDVLAGFARLESWAHAGAARVAAAIGERIERAHGPRPDQAEPGGLGSPAAHEVALALHCSRAAAARLVGDGTAFERHLAPLADLLTAGTLGPAHTRMAVDRLAVLPARLAAQVLDRALPLLPGRTPAQVGLVLDRLIAAHHGVDAAEQAAAARERRRVGLPRAVGNGMAAVTALLPMLDAARIDATLEAVARAAHTAGDPRTLAQLRADVLVDLLTGDVRPGVDGAAAVDTGTGFRLPPPGSVVVDVTISAASLLGLTDDPAHLAGLGALDAVTARALAHGGAAWRRIVTDPVTGAVLHAGRRRYRPNAAQVAHAHAALPWCVCGTCTLAAARCDLDHVVERRDGGPTDLPNLAPLDRGTHRLKTDRLLRLGRDRHGGFRWTTPLQRVVDVTLDALGPRQTRHPADLDGDPTGADPPPF